MKKKTTRTTTTKRRKTPNVAHVQQLPPIAVAIARMVEPNMDGLHPSFVRAWEAMPAILAAYANGTSDALDVVSADNLITDLVEEGIRESRQKTPENLNKGLAIARDLLEATNPDYWDSVSCCIQQQAFAVGLALGVYVMMHGGTR